MMMWHGSSEQQNEYNDGDEDERFWRKIDVDDR